MKVTSDRKNILNLNFLDSAAVCRRAAAASAPELWVSVSQVAIDTLLNPPLIEGENYHYTKQEREQQYTTITSNPPWQKETEDILETFWIQYKKLKMILTDSQNVTKSSHHKKW